MLKSQTTGEKPAGLMVKSVKSKQPLGIGVSRVSRVSRVSLLCGSSLFPNGKPMDFQSYGGLLDIDGDTDEVH